LNGSVFAAEPRRCGGAMIRSGRWPAQGPRRAVQVVRRLRARRDRQPAIGAEVRQRRVLLERQVRVALVEEAVLDHQVGARERRRHVAEVERDHLVDVAGVAVILDPRLGVDERLLGRADRRQRLVVDLDQPRRLLGDQLLGRDHRRHRIADEPHLVGAQRVLVLRHRQDAERDREHLAGQHRAHAVDRERLARIDPADLRVRQR
jgi:hypothetical protein